jgi:hypothetical protein
VSFADAAAGAHEHLAAGDEHRRDVAFSKEHEQALWSCSIES